MKLLLKWIDNLCTWFLKVNAGSMPMNFVKVVAYYHPDPYLRKIYWARLGVKMGENTLANLGLTVVRHHLGGDCVTIGDNVSIAPNVIFITDSSANNGKEINTYIYVNKMISKTEPITVKDEVWIGANAIIFPGVTLGRCSVIGANSMVIDNTDEYGIYAGSPARKIRDIRTGERAEI